MNHYVYLTRNLQTCDFYVGVRSSKCDPLEDRYLGSGIRMKAQLKKYGRDAFHKMIIREFDTRDEAMLYEKEHVNMNFLKLPGCLNLMRGGMGPREHAEQTADANARRSQSLKGRKYSEETLKRMSEAQKKAKKPQMSEEHKKLLSETLKGRKRAPFTEEHRARIAAATKKNKTGWKQKPETIARRVESFKKTMAARKSGD